MGICTSKHASFDLDKDIPPLFGKVILVTGGNTGLGKKSIIEFAKHHPSEIWMTARDHVKAQSARHDIQREVPGAIVRILQLDLASLDSVKAAVRTFLSSAKRLDILLLNAGLGGSPPATTLDGYEIFFGTNHLGHALLTKLLMPLMLNTAALNQEIDSEDISKCNSQASDVRIVILTSAMMSCVPEGGIQFDKLKSTQSDIGTSFTHYGQSKLANALFARRLAREYPQLTVTAVHPGIVKTGIEDKTAQHNVWAKLLLPLASPFMLVVDEGVKNQLWAATSEDVISGEYYVPVGVTGKLPRLAADGGLAERLWEWTESELRSHNLDL